LVAAPRNIESHPSVKQQGNRSITNHARRLEERRTLTSANSLPPPLLPSMNGFPRWNTEVGAQQRLVKRSSTSALGFVSSIRRQRG
jgi:hypothetical protein